MSFIKKKFFICCAFFLLLSFWVHAQSGDLQHLSPLTIHIIGYENRAGLTTDIEILKEELTELGHHVQFIDYRDIPKARANINLFLFLQCPLERLFPFADKNYFIPNPEWCLSTDTRIPQFDMILCKTKEAVDLFKSLNPNTVFMGFTSKDCFNPTIAKNYHSPLHMAGAQKGTKEILETWRHNFHFPSIVLLRCEPKKVPFLLANAHFITQHLPEEELHYLQNYHGLHICPSKVEGFGHSLTEALSCGAVLVTTNAPPMNEFIADERCLVNYHKTHPAMLGTAYEIQPQELEKVITHLLSLSEQELQEIGRKNRELYLKNRSYFRQQLKEIFQFQ